MFSKYANLAELRYRNEIQLREIGYHEPQMWIDKIVASGRLQILPYLYKNYHLKISGDVLELGAGSCWLTAELSKLPQVTKVYAVDFSEQIMTKIAPEVIKALGGNKEKIVLLIEDFHKLYFSDNSFDFVMVDSVLHHTEYLNIILQEARRVLKDKGKIMVMREPILPLIHMPWDKKITSKAAENYGVIEKCYTLNVWKKYFLSAQFQPIFLKINFSKGFKGLIAKLFNGIIKSDFCILAVKR